MRIKFLSFIASFFIVSFAMTSCLGDGDKIEYSPDATIRRFTLDTIHGKYYKFAIDQLKGEIYNIDSMPVGADTILDKILIDTLTTASGIVTMKTYNGEQDSVLNITDSINLKPYINAPQMGKYLKLTVWAPDLQVKKTYNISFRVHLQDPDSLNWGNKKGISPTPFKTGFSGGTITGKQKAVILNNAIYVYSKVNGQLVAYKASITNGKSWSPVLGITGLPEAQSINLSSLLQFNDKLYIVADNKIYSSVNGASWILDTALNNSNYKFMTLLGAIQSSDDSNVSSTAGISAILSTDNDATYQFGMTNEIATLWNVSEKNTVPADFPKSNITSTVSFSETGIPYMTLMGSSAAPKDGTEEDATEEKIVPWSSYNGLAWANLSTSSQYCPLLESPSIMAYNGEFYAFGNDFKVFYTSITGITWNEANKKFYFPRNLTERSGDYYSMVVDKDNFIWIICSRSSKGEDDVWRGRLNQLGFIKK